MSPIVVLREELFWLGGLGLLLVLSVANNTAVGWLGPFGEFAIAAVLAAGVLLSTVYLATTAALPRVAAGLGVAVLYVDGVYMASLAVNGDPAGLKTVAGTLGVLSLFVAVALYRWKWSGLWVFATILGVFVVASGVIASFEIVSGAGRASGVFSNPNALASFMLMAFYALALTHVASRGSVERAGLVLLAVVAVLLMIAAGTRSVWLALAASGITYWLWPRFSTSRLLHNGYFLAFLISLAALVAFVVVVPTLDIGQSINRLTETVTGRQLSTGRELIWLDVLNEVSKRPVLGHGPQVTAGGFGNLGLASAHNMYLQIVLQVGAVGLAGFVGLMWWIWNRLGAAAETKVARTTGAVLIGVLLQQSFEVSLTHNNLTLGLLAWIVIGIGVSASIWRPGWVTNG